MKIRTGLFVSSILTLGLSNPLFAADIKINGFADIIYTLTDEASDVTGSTNTTEGKFTVDGEIDFSSKLSDAISVRVDLDLAMATNGGNNASAVTGGLLIPLLSNRPFLPGR